MRQTNKVSHKVDFQWPLKQGMRKKRDMISKKNPKSLNINIFTSFLVWPNDQQTKLVKHLMRIAIGNIHKKTAIYLKYQQIDYFSAHHLESD